MEISQEPRRSISRWEEPRVEEIGLFTGAEQFIFGVLSKANRNFYVPSERLLELYNSGKRHHVGPDNLRIHIHHIRKKLKPLGGRIVMLRGIGYKLVWGDADKNGSV